MESAEFERANAKAREMQASTPRVVAARYDRRLGRVVLSLSSKVELRFAPGDAQGLEKATPAELETIEVSPSGFGIHFPKLDADLYVPALLEGFLGSQAWMAARLGEKGGRWRSAAKAESGEGERQAGRTAAKAGGVRYEPRSPRRLLARGPAAKR
jgi:hypothetical protein